MSISRNMTKNFRIFLQAGNEYRIIPFQNRKLLLDRLQKIVYNTGNDNGTAFIVTDGLKPDSDNC